MECAAIRAHIILIHLASDGPAQVRLFARVSAAPALVELIEQALDRDVTRTCHQIAILVLNERQAVCCGLPVERIGIFKDKYFRVRTKTRQLYLCHLIRNRD